jgi:hypothetical protein
MQQSRLGSKSCTLCSGMTAMELLDTTSERPSMAMRIEPCKGNRIWL